MISRPHLYAAAESVHRGLPREPTPAGADEFFDIEMIVKLLMGLIGGCGVKTLKDAKSKLALVERPILGFFARRQLHRLSREAAESRQAVFADSPSLATRRAAKRELDRDAENLSKAVLRAAWRATDGEMLLTINDAHEELRANAGTNEGTRYDD